MAPIPLKKVFRIRDILRQIRTLESMHWITDPDPDLDLDLDPALFVSGFQDVHKK
jgi:hypothetical protein